MPSHSRLYIQGQPAAVWLLPALAGAAPFLGAQVTVQCEHRVLPPGFATGLTALAGDGSVLAAADWTLLDPEAGTLAADAQGRRRLQAPLPLAHSCLARIKASWTPPGAAQAEEGFKELRLQAPDSHLRIWIPHLPDTPLHQRWVVLDPASGQVLLEDRDGRKTPWLGDPTRNAEAKEGQGLEARFRDPVAIAAPPVQAGEEGLWRLVIVDRGGSALFQADAEGQVTRLVGLPGQAGQTLDGPATEARVARPAGAAFDAKGTLYFTDAGNRGIFRLRNDRVERVAGDPDQPGEGKLDQPRAVDGLGSKARLDAPGVIVLDEPKGRLLFLDQHRLRVLVPDLMKGLAGVTTLAGADEPGSGGGQDREPSPTRMKGIPCLRNPSGLGLTDLGILILDQDGKHLRLLGTLQGEGLGALTTLDLPREEGKASRSGSAEEALPSNQPGAGLVVEPLTLDPDQFLPLAVPDPTPWPDPDQGPASAFHHVKKNLIADLCLRQDGSLLVLLHTKVCEGCARARRWTCAHGPKPRIYHLYRKDGGRDWCYRTVPVEDRAGLPPEMRELFSLDNGHAVTSDKSTVYHLVLTGGPGSLKVAKVEHRLQLGNDPKRWAWLGLPFIPPPDSRVRADAESKMREQLGLEPGDSSVSGGSAMMPCRNGSLLYKFPGRLAMVPLHCLRREGVIWYEGEPVPTTKGYKGEPHSSEPMPAIASEADGTIYTTDQTTREIQVYDGATGRKRLALARTAWPEEIQELEFKAFEGHLYLSARPGKGGKQRPIYRLSPGAPDGPFQLTRTRVELGPEGDFHITPQGDLILMTEADGRWEVRWLPAPRERNEAWRAAAQAGRPESGDSKGNPEPAPSGASQTRAASKADLAMERFFAQLRNEEAQAEAARLAAKARKERDRAEETVPLEPGEASPADSDDEAPVETKVNASGTPVPKPPRPAPRASAPSARPATQAARPYGPKGRYVPFRGKRDREGIAFALRRYATFRFREDFQEMLDRHDHKVGFNLHSYQDTTACREEIDRIFRSRRGAADVPASLRGRFALGNKTLAKIAFWMLANVKHANQGEDPWFTVSYVVDSGSAGLDNRIVVDLLDVSKVLKKFGDDAFDQYDTSRETRARDELKATGFRTGLTFNPNGPAQACLGVRLVIGEACRFVATCHPFGETSALSASSDPEARRSGDSAQARTERKTSSGQAGQRAQPAPKAPAPQTLPPNWAGGSYKKPAK